MPKLPVASILVGLALVIVAVVGGVVTITNPQTLSFPAYLADVQKAAIAGGLLGIGRGLHIGLTNLGGVGKTIEGLFQTSGVEREIPGGGIPPVAADQQSAAAPGAAKPTE